MEAGQQHPKSTPTPRGHPTPEKAPAPGMQPCSQTPKPPSSSDSQPGCSPDKQTESHAGETIHHPAGCQRRAGDPRPLAAGRGCGASPARGAARGTSQGDAGKAEWHSYLWAGRSRIALCLLQGSAPCPGVPPRIRWQRESPHRSTGCPTCTSAQMPAGSTPPRCPPATWNWHSNNLAAASAASLYPRT